MDRRTVEIGETRLGTITQAQPLDAIRSTPIRTVDAKVDDRGTYDMLVGARAAQSEVGPV